MSGNAVNTLVTGGSAETVHEPVASFNTGKLSAEIEKFFSQYNREPVPDSYRIEDGELVYSPEISGVRVDYAALVERIGAHINSLSQEAVEIRQDDPEVFAAVTSDPKEKDEVYRFVVSSSRIRLGETDRNTEEEILEGLNGSIIPPGEMVQLSKMLDLSGLALEGRQDPQPGSNSGIPGFPAQRYRADRQEAFRDSSALPEPGLETVICGRTATGT